MSHYVHYVTGDGRRWDAGHNGRELNALRHELRAVLAMLEHRRRWQTSIVPFALVAHARRLVQTLEHYVDGPCEHPARNAEAAEFRERLVRVQKTFRATGWPSTVS